MLIPAIKTAVQAIKNTNNCIHKKIQILQPIRYHNFGIVSFQQSSGNGYDICLLKNAVIMKMYFCAFHSSN